MHKLHAHTLILILSAFGTCHAVAAEIQTPYPIMFVTQVPVAGDFGTITATFTNHHGDVKTAARGGALYIRYEDGTLKNLTLAAGFGKDNGDQTGDAASQGVTGGGIAVRDPCIHWSGTKALFSMAIGSPTHFQIPRIYWQMYEITGLGLNDTPVITKIASQPETYNNISPIYGSDERIIFTSDRPRNGDASLYPQLDEYESAPVVTGLWSLDPATSNLFLMNHTPSGAFTPIIDSAGRVVFSRWDHLIRDQQADADSLNPTYGTFDYTDETPSAQALFNTRKEVFPEPRAGRTEQLAGTNLEGLAMNQFFPWQINQDGSDEEILNHLGRHELSRYFNRVFNDDPNLFERGSDGNYDGIDIILQMTEDPQTPGRFYGVESTEFGTRSAGRIVYLDAPVGKNPDTIKGVTSVTHPVTYGFNLDNEPADPNHTGHYRNPLVLSDGTLIASHTSETRAESNEGTSTAPNPRYKFRLKRLVNTGTYFEAEQLLTSGFSRTISYYDPDAYVTYTGELWELQPVEVRPRTKPAKTVAVAVAAPEAAIFAEESVAIDTFQTYLKQNNLALVIGRNVLTRDFNDRQQPFNLKVAGTDNQIIGAAGKIYDVLFTQFLQGDLVRGIGWHDSAALPPTERGRRVLARPLHDPAAKNVPVNDPSAPAGSVRIANDGSIAALIPAQRAMSWQMTDGGGTPVVRERYWVSFQPGEIRTCTSCHGLNTKDQAGNGTPQNKPEALRELLKYWKAGSPPGNGGGGGTPILDSDSDGVGDAEEIAAGTNPNDKNSAPQTLTLPPLKLRASLNLKAGATDQVQLSAILADLSPDFAPAGTQVSIDLAGVNVKFALDAKRKATTDKHKLTFRLKKNRKTALAQGTLSAKLKGSGYATIWESALAGSKLPLTVIVPQRVYRGDIAVQIRSTTARKLIKSP
jgi:hypothetical protein